MNNINKRVIFLCFIATLCITSVTGTNYYLNPNNGTTTQGCGTADNTCLGLNYLPPLQSGDIVNFSAGQYLVEDNFPFSINYVLNITFQGSEGVIFECATAGLTECITVTIPTGEIGSILFDSVTFTGFTIDEESVSPMLRIVSDIPFRRLIQNLDAVVEFQNCVFSENLNNINYSYEHSNPSHHHSFHLSQLIYAEEVALQLDNCSFIDNGVAALFVLYSNLSMLNSSSQTSLSQFIHSDNSLVYISDCTFDSNGNNYTISYISAQGADCQSYNPSGGDYHQCSGLYISNSFFKNNIASFHLIELQEGAKLVVNSTEFRNNTAGYAISSFQSNLASVVQLDSVSFVDNVDFFVELLFGSGSYMNNFTVNNSDDEAVSYYFLTLLSGSSLSIDNWQYSAGASPLTAIDSLLLVSNSHLVSSSLLVMSANAPSLSATVIFSDTVFSVPGSIISTSGYSTVYFYSCTSANYAPSSLICLSSNSIIYFDGSSNSGFSVSPSSCNLLCNSNNQVLCENGDSGSDNTDDSTSAWIWILAVALILTLIYAIIVSVFGVYFYRRKASDSTSYDVL